MSFEFVETIDEVISNLFPVEKVTKARSRSSSVASKRS